jgi:hypothetical protein
MCFSVCVTPKQLEVLRKGSKLSSRANVFPVLKPVVNHQNTDRKEKTTDAEGKPVDIFHTSELVLSEGQVLRGVTSHGFVEFANMSPASMMAKATNADGTVTEHEVLAGKTTMGFFEGTFFLCYLPACDGKPARVRVGADRQVISNFCGLFALPLRVEGSDVYLNFPNVEAVFQLLKAILTGDASILEEAMGQKKPGDLKKFMNKVKGIPDAWFNAVDGASQSLAYDAMEFLQFWAATCPVRHETLRRIMEAAGVDAEHVDIYEHNEDGNYGTKSLPEDIRPLFDHDYVPKGGNVMGRAITAVARKVVELKTHAAYVAWFEGNFAPIFKLKEEETTSLGARTASQAELPLPAAGRSLSSSDSA